MKTSFRLLILLTSFSLSGCNQMLEVSQNVREGLSSTMSVLGVPNRSVTISETPSQICRTYKENSLKARIYQDKRISFKAKALEITDVSDLGYAVISFKVKNTRISFLTKDLMTASNVVKGKTYTATGSIHKIDDDIDTTDLNIKCSMVIQGESLN